MTPGFKLREWKLADADSLTECANHAEIARNLTDTFPFPFTREAAVSFINRVTGDHPAKVLTIDIGGQASGSIGVFPQHDIFRYNAEMGYWLAIPYWGKGIMTAAVTEMVGYAFEHFEINRIFARPFGTNTGSQRVLEKCGFKLEARFEGTIVKNGIVHDELVYAIRRAR